MISIVLATGYLEVEPSDWIVASMNCLEAASWNP